MNKPKKIVSLFLIFSLLPLSGNLMAKKRGAELIIQKKDGLRIRGELIAVKQNSLLLLVSGADVSADIQDIKVIRIMRKSKTLLGAGLGFLAGASIGFIVGAVFVPKSRFTKTSWFLSEEEQGAIGATIGGPIGLVIGAVIGGTITDKTIALYDKTQDEVERILEKLSSKARIPDYR